MEVRRLKIVIQKLIYKRKIMRDKIEKVMKIVKMVVEKKKSGEREYDILQSIMKERIILVNGKVEEGM